MISGDIGVVIQVQWVEDVGKKRTSINWYTVQPPEIPLSQVLEEARTASVHRSPDEIDELVERAVKRAKHDVPLATRLHVLTEQERQLQPE